MSVIVMGMEMPVNCADCGIEFCVKWIYQDVRKRPKDCPLRPLPEKHGRLIDAEELEDVFYEYHSQSVGYVQDMETIVEAEGE